MSKKSFLDKSNNALSQIYDVIENLPYLKLSELEPTTTALIIIDIINGFVKEGALYSPRNEALTEPISKLSAECSKHKIVKLAFADTHSENSLEFKAYPPHCIKGTSECEVASELEDYVLIEKNSTNGFLENQFEQWLKLNSHINTFIVVGNCTDICISQFATTLKTYFNKNDIESRIIVVEQLVNTFDGGIHVADLMHTMALFTMSGDGIELVKNIV